MIGTFNPLVVITGPTLAAASSPIFVRSTSAATEITNDIAWIYWD